MGSLPTDQSARYIIRLLQCHLNVVFKKRRRKKIRLFNTRVTVSLTRLFTARSQKRRASMLDGAVRKSVGSVG